MKRLIYTTMLFIGMLGTTNLLSAQEAGVKQKFIILPLANQVDTNRFFSFQAENAGLVTFLSIYDFMRRLPFVDVPDKKVLQQIPNENPDLEGIARKQDADLIFYGEYRFKGKSETPEAVILVKVWSASLKKDVFSKSYNTFTDIDLLDTVDQIIKDAISTAFNIEAQFATVKFSHFNIKIDPNNRYKLLVNNKELTRVTNQNFTYSLKVLANTSYNFSLIREQDNTLVRNTFVTLKGGETTNLSYQGRATLKIGAISGKEPGNSYKILVDGKEVKEGDTLANIPVNIKHIILLLKNSRIIEQKKVLLSDKETRTVHLGKTVKRNLYYRAYTFNRSFGGLGVDLFFGNSLWAGLNIGLSFYKNVFVPASTLNLSYYLLGDKATSIRVGAGLIGGGHYALPKENWDAVYFGPNYNFFAGLSTVVEWKFIYVRVSVVHDFNSSEQTLFIPEIGVKF